MRLSSGTFRLLTQEFLGPRQLLSYLRTIQNMLITLLAGSQVSDHCPFGYFYPFYIFFLFVSVAITKL